MPEVLNSNDNGLTRGDHLEMSNKEDFVGFQEFQAPDCNCQVINITVSITIIGDNENN